MGSRAAYLSIFWASIYNWILGQAAHLKSKVEITSYMNWSRVTLQTPSQIFNLSRADSASSLILRSIFSLRGTNLALNGSG